MKATLKTSVAEYEFAGTIPCHHPGSDRVEHFRRYFRHFDRLQGDFLRRIRARCHSASQDLQFDEDGYGMGFRKVTREGEGGQQEANRTRILEDPHRNSEISTTEYTNYRKAFP